MNKNGSKGTANYLLTVAVLLMIVASIHRFSNEFERLLFDQSFNGATDLKFRHRDVQNWFAGVPVYSDKDAIYPPASFVLLWPFVGWLSVSSARILWAITSVPALGWLIVLLLKQSQGMHILEKMFVVLLAPAMYATGATIGNGQLILHLLPVLLASLLLVEKRGPCWKRDLASASLFLFALVKPAITIPFVWLYLFRSERWRPVLLTVLGYAAITWFAVSFQSAPLTGLLGEWLNRGSAAALRGGYANVHSWLSTLGLSQIILPVTGVIWISLGIWIRANRRADFWLLLGVTGLVARLSIYHRLYDDLLVIFAIIALFRLYREQARSQTALVLAVLWASALAPARLLTFPAPWNLLFEAGQATTWLITLVYLILECRKANRAYSNSVQSPAGTNPSP